MAKGTAGSQFLYFFYFRCFGLEDFNLDMFKFQDLNFVLTSTREKSLWRVDYTCKNLTTCQQDVFALLGLFYTSNFGRVECNSNNR